MKGTELPGLVQALRDPVDGFVRNARVRIALLISTSGQVLAQHGFTGRYEVMNVASLAAAAHASSRALADLTRSGGWTHLYHSGRDRQLFLAPLATPIHPLILVSIFDADSSLGIVQFFFDRLAEQVARLPELARATGSTDQASFEQDLEAGIERIFSNETESAG